MERDRIERHKAFSQRWYYRLELAPGLFTDGAERPNVALTRELLAKVELGPDTRCVDIGIQEGLVSILMERRGAQVVGYDRVYSLERLELVRAALGVRFELIGDPITEHAERRRPRGRPTPGLGMPLDRLPRALAARGHGPFDVAIYSGVLYHVYDPLTSLALVRGLVRHGGMVIVETAAIFDGRFSLHLNAEARFNRSSVWLPSLAVLDYMLRLVRLCPIDVVQTGRRRGRVAIACRAVVSPPGTPEDEWIRSPLHDYELAEHLEWDRLASDRPQVGYSDEDERIDVLQAVRANPPLRPDPAQRRLDLDAVT